MEQGDKGEKRSYPSPESSAGQWKRQRPGGRNIHAKSSDPKFHSTPSPNSPIVKMFSELGKKLDMYHDKYERIVKLSRDTTIESKRIIFLLHRLAKTEKPEGILSEAEERLATLRKNLFRSLALELEGEDPWHFHRAFTSGLQEFVEAVTFYNFLKDHKIPSCSNIQNDLVFTEDDGRSISVLISPHDYLLGIADLTGEIMRHCINRAGDRDACLGLCGVVQELHKSFILVGNRGPREVSRKFTTLTQSVEKMENACYALVVQGTEAEKQGWQIPSEKWAETFQASTASDEGIVVEADDY